MNLQLKDNAVVVAGGASGIGLAIAQAFSAEGCRVGVVDIAEPADEQALQADLRDYPALQGAAATFRKRFGRIDHAVCAAAIGSGKYGFPFWNLKPKDWTEVVEVNLLGAVNFAHAFTPHLIEGSKGSITFLASVAGQTGSQTDPPYSAAKAGVINFMQCAAKDLAPYGIRANAISPGMVKTSLNQSVWKALQDSLPEEKRQDYETWAQAKISNIAPLDQWQTPEECAAAALFLASPLARNITGQTLNVDGGQVMHS